MSKVEIDRSRFLMIDRIVKTSDGYFIYIFGKNNMPEEMRERKNREYLCIRKIFKNSTKIKAVNYSTKENTFTINNTSSDNNAYNMKALAQEALKLRVPNSLTVIDLNHFYVGMIPIDHNQILTMIPHINTTNIPFNYQKITNFIGSKIFGVGKYFHSKSTRP